MLYVDYAPESVWQRIKTRRVRLDMDEANPLASGWRYETVGRETAEKFGVG